MPIPITCGCGKRLAAPDALAGRRVKCPGCGQTVAVPAAGAVQPAAVVPPAAAPSPAMPPTAGPTRTSGKALTSMILGLVSLCLGGPLLAVPAIILGFLGLRDIKRSQGLVTGSGLAVTGLIVGFIETLVLFPIAVFALWIAFSKTTESADRMRTQNRMSQIGVALNGYALAGGDTFPLASDPRRGAHPVSWRVAILDFIEGDDLVRQYNFNEPWDSPNNLKLLDKMPSTYAHPRAGPHAPAGSTYFQAVVGPRTVMGGPNPVSPIAVVNGRGASQTIMVVETADPVPWTKPQDVLVDPSTPLPKLGRFSGGFFALFVDRSVRFIPSRASEASIRLIATYDGHESWPADIPN